MFDNITTSYSEVEEFRTAADGSRLTACPDLSGADG